MMFMTIPIVMLELVANPFLSCTVMSWSIASNTTDVGVFSQCSYISSLGTRRVSRIFSGLGYSI